MEDGERARCRSRLHTGSDSNAAARGLQDVGVCCTGCQKKIQATEPCKYVARDQQLEGGGGKYTCCSCNEQSQALSLRFSAGAPRSHDSASVGALLSIPLDDPRLPIDGATHALRFSIESSSGMIRLDVDGSTVATAQAPMRIVRIVTKTGDRS